MCVLTRQIYLAVKCRNKFSMGGIFHWTYLSFSLFFSLFSPFLYPFLFFSLFPFPLSLSLATSGCLFNLIRIHLIPDYFYTRDRSLFIVGGKALENFVCVTIKVTWSSISLCLWICHGGVTGVTKACQHFLTFEGMATESESLLHSTFIRAILLPPEMFTRPQQDASDSLFVLRPWCNAIGVRTPPTLHANLKCS